MKKKMNYMLTALLTLSISVLNAQHLPTVQTTKFKADTFNIIRYGAKSDGLTLNTKAITNTIDACAKNGGGVVLVPSGFWVTGPLVLKSNVNLYISRAAILQFTDDLSQYPLVEGNWEGLPSVRNQSPLSATNAQNIAITGTGIIDGNGDVWRAVKKDKLTESQWKKLVGSGGLLSDDQKTWYPSASSFKGFQTKEAGVLKDGRTAKDFENIKDFLRPNLLVLTSCKKVLLEGVTFQNSPAWCLHPLMCEDLVVRKVYAKNPWYAQNGDGIDIESCKNFILENSTFDVGDDGICIKSGRDEAGRKRGMPTENGIIRNCVVYHAHGGFVIGSEMSGGAKNLYVSNCSFMGTDVGLRFKTTRGRGGIVEKIFINNIYMKDILGEAILFDMYYMAKDPVPLAGENREEPKVVFYPITEATPQFRNFQVRNVVCIGAEKAIFIRGLPEMSIKDIDLQDISIQSRVGIVCEEANGIKIKNLQLLVKNTNPVISFLNSSNILFENVQYNKGAELLARLRGASNNNIILKNVDVSMAKKGLEFGTGVNENVIQIK